MNDRAHALANRLERGAEALAAFADALSDAEWKTRLPNDGRTIGVVVHHVATVYPVEIGLAQTLASGHAISGVTWDVIHAMNASHEMKQRVEALKSVIAWRRGVEGRKILVLLTSELPMTLGSRKWPCAGSGACSSATA